MDKQLYTVAVFSENQVGLLNQISIIFTRRCLNIESLSVSPSSIKGIHKFIITCYSDGKTMERVVKQIDKRIDVIKSYLYTDDDIIYQEIALYKVPTSALAVGTGAEELIRRYNARVLELTADYVVIEKTGHLNETEMLFADLEKFGILQFVRSGRVAVTKSKEEQLSQFLRQIEQERADAGNKRES